MNEGNGGLDNVLERQVGDDSERLGDLIDPAVLANEASAAGVYSLAGNGEGGNSGDGGAQTGNAETQAGTAETLKASPSAPQSDAAPGEAQSGTPGPQPVNPLAAAITLLLASPPHRHLFIADLEWRLLPAIASGQFRLITKDNRPLAFVTWAFLSDEIKERLKNAVGQDGGSSGAGRLKPEEWRSGKNHVIVDFVSPFVTDEDERKRMLASVFATKKKEGGEQAG